MGRGPSAPQRQRSEEPLRAKLGECFVDGYNVQAVEMDVASLRAAKPKEKFNGVTAGGRQLSFK